MPAPNSAPMDSLETYEADARLIAAAPEMLQALRSSRETLLTAIRAGCDLPSFDPRDHRAIKEIDAAISKATGEQP